MTWPGIHAVAGLACRSLCSVSSIYSHNLCWPFYSSESLEPSKRTLRLPQATHFIIKIQKKKKKFSTAIHLPGPGRCHSAPGKSQLTTRCSGVHRPPEAGTHCSRSGPHLQDDSATVILPLPALILLIALTHCCIPCALPPCRF